MTNDDILAQFGPRESMEYDVVIVGGGASAAPAEVIAPPPPATLQAAGPAEAPEPAARPARRQVADDAGRRGIERPEVERLAVAVALRSSSGACAGSVHQSSPADDINDGERLE